VTRIIVPGRNCWKVDRVEHAGVLVDARDYYRAFYQAMSGARNYVLLAGWQFDSDVRLLRGEDVTGAPLPVELLPFLEALCRERPTLSIYILAWDYSVVYTLEREWMQRLKFDFGTSDQIKYVLDGKHPLGASHHQKLVVVDGRVAFVGGADICDGRWDDRRHASENAERVNRYGEPYKPYHEVIGYVTGAVVAGLEQTFRARWQRATGEELPRFPPPPDAESVRSDPRFEGALPIQCERVAIARTYPAYDDDGTEAVHEIRHLYEDAIGAAEKLIYLETQYLTSRAIHDALLARLRDDGRPRLQIVIVVPHGSDSLKEQIALGTAEDATLASIDHAARSSGHSLRVLYSAPDDGSSESPPTFIHSKLLIVDDEFMTLGSANCTNRSLAVDSELNLAWECRKEQPSLGKSMARLRASLVSEHAGVAHDERLEKIEGFTERIDELSRTGKRLRPRSLPARSDECEPLPIMQIAFDPEGPLLEGALAELLGQRRQA
jgi:phosphatidylserine/phosphatidylglycerophosphate/cardiolipin synthase-like enzyme